LNQRYSTLDYLRGFMASAIMIYHHAFWTFGPMKASAPLGRLGIYGVSIFYVLSGLTMFLVYRNKFDSGLNSITSFGIKRVFRIFPLLWLVIVATLVLRGSLPDYKVIILNFTGLFGFIKPDAYIGTGVWSIGNELVFYAFFPLFIYLAKKSLALFNVACILTFGVNLYFAFYALDDSKLLVDEWATYINPLNQLVLFAVGIAIGVYQDRLHEISRRVWVALLIASILTFVLWPVEGDLINVVTGFNRQLFLVICFVLCTAFFLGPFAIKGVCHRLLSFLGEASYSIYLLHPVIYKLLERVTAEFINSKVTLMILSITTTVAASKLVYEYFEKPMMKLGKRVADSRTKSVEPGL
jgi:exopolysaccharide production protein ExoZ